MNLSRFSACQCTHRHTHLEEVFFVVVVEIKDKSKAKILPILQPLSKRFVPASLLKHVEKKIILRLPTTFLYFYIFKKEKRWKRLENLNKKSISVTFWAMSRWWESIAILRPFCLFLSNSFFTLKATSPLFASPHITCRHIDCLNQKMWCKEIAQSKRKRKIWNEKEIVLIVCRTRFPRD